MLINIVFWACFEQAGTSLTLFADRNVAREILGWTMPASMTQFFNPFFIIVFGSIFSMMWVKLSKIGKNPSIPMKFAFGILQLGLGFLVTMIGFQLQTEFMVPLLTLVFLYLLHTTGELFISPIGLSMVTKLSPKNIAGTAMGGWFLSFAIANFLGGQIAALTGAEGGSHEKKEESGLTMKTTVKEAIGNDANFEDWITLNNQPKNITLQKYYDLKDWVEFRNYFDSDLTLKEWLSNRSIYTKFESSEEWLDNNSWAGLNMELSKLISQVDENAISFDSWMYFRGGFFDDGTIDGFKIDDTNSLRAYFQNHKNQVLENGLNKYVDIFSIIGFVLIGFSILIALLSKPLNKLMHGIE